MALRHACSRQASRSAGIRGIALSAPINDEPSDFTAIEPWLERALDALLARQEPRLVNVNFPANPRTLRWTAQAVDQYNGKVVPDSDPMGREHFWFTVIPLEQLREGTDVWAVEQGYVSLTPLRLDLTDHEELKRVTESMAWAKGEAREGA